MNNGQFVTHYEEESGRDGSASWNGWERTRDEEGDVVSRTTESPNTAHEEDTRHGGLRTRDTNSSSMQELDGHLCVSIEDGTSEGYADSNGPWHGEMRDESGTLTWSAHKTQDTRQDAGDGTLYAHSLQTDDDAGDGTYTKHSNLQTTQSGSQQVTISTSSEEVDGDGTATYDYVLDGNGTSTSVESLGNGVVRTESQARTRTEHSTTAYHTESLRTEDRDDGEGTHTYGGYVHRTEEIDGSKGESRSRHWEDTTNNTPWYAPELHFDGKSVYDRSGADLTTWHDSKTHDASIGSDGKETATDTCVHTQWDAQTRSATDDTSMTSYVFASGGGSVVTVNTRCWTDDQTATRCAF